MKKFTVSKEAAQLDAAAMRFKRATEKADAAREALDVAVRAALNAEQKMGVSEVARRSGLTRTAIYYKFRGEQQ